MADRDDRQLEHFSARGKQPKVLASGPALQQGVLPNAAPVQVFISFDQPFGNTLDQIDDARFRYTGTSQVPVGHNRAVLHDCVGSTFTY
jgi:hypothetical protein